jgi:hypothetical protein
MLFRQATITIFADGIPKLLIAVINRRGPPEASGAAFRLHLRYATK